MKQTSLKTASAKPALSPQLASQIERYPENRRRPVNKILFKNDYFHLTYSMREKSMTISSRGDIVYSAIPYDTCRSYIQRAAVQYLADPDSVHRFVKLHRSVLETYLIASIYQITQNKVERNSAEVIEAYQAIFQNPLFEIQIMGRLLQHNETGPLSANLAGKFLYSENVKTGIAEYVSEYISFVIQLLNQLPLTTDGNTIRLLEAKQKNGVSLTSEADIKPVLKLRPLLKSEYGKELSEVRKNYIAHSVSPEQLEQYFGNVLPAEKQSMLSSKSIAKTKI